MKILHIADIHWRGLSRHEEYILAFNDLFKKARVLEPDIIYVGGDIVHSKTQGISPELIQNLCWWFKQLCSIAPTHVILGNHDGLMMNKDRQDAISPIVDALDIDNLFLYKKSGTYEFAPGYEWCVLSCFDEENFFKAKPTKDNISIALYHGAVRGSLTDIDWQLDGDDDLNLFKSYDFSMLGDIHKMQFLNDKKTIAYSGSTLQQSFGEGTEKGFLFWDIRTKDDFDVDFHEVTNQFKFVTIDWQGSVEKTVNKCKQYPNLSRFRIAADNYISQADIRQLQKLLLKNKAATEVVFKIESRFDADKIKTHDLQETLDLRNPDKHLELIEEYYKNNNLSIDDKTQLKVLIDKSLSEITTNNDNLRNAKWSINQVKFDNMFSYGEGNLINFESLPGITGVFGRNARGKSSIIGTIAYGLYNTTDRGSIKNIHVVNARRSSCMVEMDISINSIPYRIIRTTKKKVTKKGVWAPTDLGFYRLDSSGEIIEDLAEEQRRETEKIIRSMIGDPESFLMTSLASQGEMNTFIKEKATSRKNILSNFLDLTVFEKMNEYAKKESAVLKSQIKSHTKVNWGKEIRQKFLNVKDCVKSINSLDEEKHRLQRALEAHLKELHSSNDIKYIYEKDVDQAKHNLDKITGNVFSAQAKLDSLIESISESDGKIIKISNFVDNFDVNDVKEKRDIQKRIEKTLVSLSNELKSEKRELQIIKKSADKLSEVPCGDKFPTCKFIKESHKNKNLMSSQEDKVLSLKIKVDDLKDSFKKIKNTDYELQIEKYNSLLTKRSNLISSLSSKKVSIKSHEKDIEVNQPKINEFSEIYNDLKERYESQDTNDMNQVLEKKIRSIKHKIVENDESKTQNISRKARLTENIKTLESKKKEYEKISKDMRVYDLFIQATSNRGIPVQIIHSMIPQINSEIAKILKGVVGFTVELEVDLESSSAMDLYINYGDSKRIIELGSGMEKMMASLAIRVALINVSTLPKASILMIDEGFGSLDETNIEACGKLLQSLKKWFRNIVVISHIDAIKDIVDNTIDITKKGANSYVYQP